MNNARSGFEESVTGLKNIFRNLWVKAGDVSENIIPLFDMIPGDNGLSVLRSGLVLIFMVSLFKPSYHSTPG
jgi:hypothetical protein